MSNKKVQFADLSDSVADAEYSGEIGGDVAEDLAAGRFKEKHSLDSDEEDADDGSKYDVLADDDIEGQEEGTVGIEEGIQITPFNMREELDEGHFDKQGMYIFDQTAEIRDNWIDEIDWVRIKEREKGTDDKPSEPEDVPELDLHSSYTQMLALLKPGESIMKALRRLGGGRMLSASQRLKAKKQKQQGQSSATATEQSTEDKENFSKLTGLADQILQAGDMEIYEATYEKLTFDLKSMQEKSNTEDMYSNTAKNKIDSVLDLFDDEADGKPSEAKIPRYETKATESSEADMFADDFDVKDEDAVQNNGSETAKADDTGEDDGTPVSSGVLWEYKWDEGEDAALHGPYNSSQMLQWTEDDYFPDGVFVRKVGKESKFYSSRRIDFDLYT